jgi:hypothetical protein
MTIEQFAREIAQDALPDAVDDAQVQHAVALTLLQERTDPLERGTAVEAVEVEFAHGRHFDSDGSEVAGGAVGVGDGFLAAGFAAGMSHATIHSCDFFVKPSSPKRRSMSGRCAAP